jgi:hypothetical protein
VLDHDNESFVQVERREPVNVTPAPEQQQAPMSRLKASMGKLEIPAVEIQEVVEVSNDSHE